MTKAELKAKCDELDSQVADLLVDRTNLDVQVVQLQRKYDHEVGRLNRIIDNYRTELVRMGAIVSAGPGGRVSAT